MDSILGISIHATTSAMTTTANAPVETVLITIAAGTTGGNTTLAIVMMIHTNSVVVQTKQKHG